MPVCHRDHRCITETYQLSPLSTLTANNYPPVTENVTLELTIISFASCHHFEKSIIWSVGRVFPFNSLSPDGFFQSLLRVKMPLAKTLHCPSL